MKLLPRLWRQIWPFPQSEQKHDTVWFDQKEAKDLGRITELKDFKEDESSVYLEAARLIDEEETRRKAGAESRATAFIAAIATLVPLMTWALGTSPPACKAYCHEWSAVFTVSVTYFILAAYWSLRTLEVSRFTMLGVEDVLDIKERRRPLVRQLVKLTLSMARQNRETINKKMDYISLAQRSFFNGLVLLALLLAVDPWIRF